jgi:hypothetical protein
MHNRDNLGQDMKAAQDTIKQQGGAQDQGMEGDGMQAPDPDVQQNP